LQLDEIDWKIIKELQQDGRRSFRELGEAIKYTGLGAKKRVEKLLGQKMIEVSASINSEALNINLAMLFLEMESSEAMQAVLDRFRDCPRIINFFTTLGGYNLIAFVMAEDKGALECESIEKCSLRSARGIRRSEFFPIRNVHYKPFINLRLPTNLKEGLAPCGADCLSCKGYQSTKCVGCPSSLHYRGPIRGLNVK
jgi:DNA-binding Lrp family transcriptional regulator